MPYASRLKDRTSYDTFGRVWTSSTPSTESRFAFTGRDLDPESDLYHYRARYYDPATGQFISADPIGFEAGDGNLCRYVGNGPIDGTDPSGLQPPSPYSMGDYNSSAFTGESYDPMRKYRNMSSPRDDALAQIAQRRSEFQARASEQILRVLKEYYVAPEEFGSPTEAQLRHVSDIVAEVYVSGVEQTAHQFSGARPRQGDRWPWEQDSAESDPTKKPVCATWAGAMSGILRGGQYKRQSFPIGTGIVRVGDIFRFKRAQGHSRIPYASRYGLKRLVLGQEWAQHNYVIGYPAGCEEDLPPDDASVIHYWDLVEGKRYKEPSLLVFDPWKRMLPDVYPASDYETTNTGLVDDKILYYAPKPEWEGVPSNPGGAGFPWMPND